MENALAPRIAPSARPAPANALAGLYFDPRYSDVASNPTPQFDPTMRGARDYAMDERGRGHRIVMGFAANPAIFAGPVGASPARMAAFRRAEQMENAGEAARAIRDRTGWFRAPDGGWRWEIADDAASFTPAGQQALAAGTQARPSGSVPLGEALDHPDFFRAYPNARDMPLTVGPRAGNSPTASGAYAVGDPLRLDDMGAIALRAGQPPERAVNVLLHELQHAVQTAEGFGRGTSPMMAWAGPNRPRAMAEYARLVQERLTSPLSLDDFARQAWGQSEITPEIAKAHREYLRQNAQTLRDVRNMTGPISRMLQEEAGRNVYRAASGEVEARAVQARANLPPLTRGNRDPLLDYAAEAAR